MEIKAQKYSVARGELEVVARGCNSCMKMVRPDGMDKEAFKRFTYAMGQNFVIVDRIMQRTNELIAAKIDDGSALEQELEQRIRAAEIEHAMVDETGAIVMDDKDRIRMDKSAALDFEKVRNDIIAEVKVKEASINELNEAHAEAVLSEQIEVDFYRFDFEDTPDVVLGSWLYCLRFLFDNAPILPPAEDNAIPLPVN